VEQIPERHFVDVAASIADGYVVPFLGAGANLCDRPDGVPWGPGSFLPSGGELAKALAEKSSYPVSDDDDLLRVSQYIDAVRGEKVLYRYLRTIFDADYPPNSLHRFLARIPAFLRERDAPQLLAITTNYDDLLERALDEKGEKYDLVWYEAKERDPLAGKFIHRAPGAEPVGIDVPNEYDGLSPDKQTVILKLHGAVDRTNKRDDSFVITEDNYIDYLSRGDI
jgi:SIR2-like protein